MSPGTPSDEGDDPRRDLLRGADRAASAVAGVDEPVDQPVAQRPASPARTSATRSMREPRQQQPPGSRCARGGSGVDRRKRDVDRRRRPLLVGERQHADVAETEAAHVVRATTATSEYLVVNHDAPHRSLCATGHPSRRPSQTQYGSATYSRSRMS